MGYITPLLAVRRLVIKMLKRKAASDEGAPAAKEQKSDPIPRNLSTQSVTLNFVQRTWETFIPGKLYYLPVCQTPRYIFDNAMRAQFNKFRGIWNSMEIHQPSVKMSNFIMLQDDVRVLNNTPIDSTAFTQVIYLLDFTPSSNSMFFKLANATNFGAEETNTLTYNLQPEGETQFTQVNGFADFDHLCVIPAKADLHAGFSSGINPEVDEQGNISASYIAPDAPLALRQFSAVVNVPDNNNTFLSPNNVITFARNEDRIHTIQYGDKYKWAPVTNLNGKRLMNVPANDFLYDQYLDIPAAGNTYRRYVGEFAYPGRNRPYLSRHSNLDPSLEPIKEVKTLTPLTHKFFCVAPIRKPDNALLGQRCNFLLEQHVSVTFHCSQGTFTDTDVDSRMIDQDHSIITRRHVFPTPETITPPNLLCPARDAGYSPSKTAKQLASGLDVSKIYPQQLEELQKILGPLITGTSGFVSNEKNQVQGSVDRASDLRNDIWSYEASLKFWYEILNVDANNHTKAVEARFYYHTKLGKPGVEETWTIDVAGIPLKLDKDHFTKVGEGSAPGSEIFVTFVMFNFIHYFAKVTCKVFGPEPQRAISKSQNVFYA